MHERAGIVPARAALRQGRLRHSAASPGAALLQALLLPAQMRRCAAEEHAAQLAQPPQRCMMWCTRRRHGVGGQSQRRRGLREVAGLRAPQRPSPRQPHLQPEAPHASLANADGQLQVLERLWAQPHVLQDALACAGTRASRWTPSRRRAGGQPSAVASPLAFAVGVVLGRCWWAGPSLARAAAGPRGSPLHSEMRSLSFCTSR